MTPNHSENWRHLEMLVTGSSATHRARQHDSYADHIHAKALSLFLAHATLGTPKLDRATVDAVLAGRTPWPRNGGESLFSGVAVPLSLLEENGLVAFYAGWCTVRCQTLRTPYDVDPSLVQLIRAVEHLKDICYGRNDYIQPHYTCPVSELDGLLAAHFGSATAAALLPELVCENGYYKLPPGNQNFDRLVSSCLWLALRESLEPKLAFDRWILCFCVNCNCAMPVLFDDSDHQDRIEFCKQLVNYLAEDISLGLSTQTLWMQSINVHDFSRIVAPVSTVVRMTVGLSEGSHRSEQENIELAKPTLATLKAAYPLSSTGSASILEFVSAAQQLECLGYTEWFYTWLLADSLAGSIRIDGQLLASSDFPETVLALAESRPILKHLLLNAVMRYEKAPNYKLFLLSRPATCDVALFYLTQPSFGEGLDKAYQRLVCQEYLRALDKQDDFGGRLLAAMEVLAARCNLQANEFYKGSAYRFLSCLLDHLSPEQIIQLGQALVLNPCRPQHRASTNHYRYFLGLWLIERLEASGADPSKALPQSLKTALLDQYTAQFEATFAGHRHGLEPNAFFSVLPWHRLMGHEGIGPLLALSNRCQSWQQSLRHTSEHAFLVVSAVRHYLQVLMCVGRRQGTHDPSRRIAGRIAEIVRTLGFGPREDATYLFDGAFYAGQYDLWTPFCSYANLLPDDLYSDLIDRCVQLVPLDQLFVLLDRCTVRVRARALQDVIASRQTPDENLGLGGLERAFVAACESGQTALAGKLMAAAKHTLSQDRFANMNNPHVQDVRRGWVTYEYKWQLMDLLEAKKNDPEAFADAARKIPLPQASDRKSPVEAADRAQERERDRFLRYVIAAAYLKADPGKCVGIMKALYGETKNRHHGFLLFEGHLGLYNSDNDAVALRHALSQFLTRLGEIDPQDMPTRWVASILGAYQRTQNAAEIDTFWRKLTTDQQNRVEVLHPYCKALIERGDALIAQQIITLFRDLNKQPSVELGIDDLMGDLLKSLPDTPPADLVLRMMVDDAQRSAVQLTRHYKEIVSRDFDAYVSVISPDTPPHEFLKDVVLEVARELLLRKKNLQIHEPNGQGKTNLRITKEDLINDWFTSLFDKRMAEARLGLRDQKRGGQSASGKGPGEIDGYITDAKNRRIAIFEAFRLFSKDTTVISDHLDKMSGYDHESLSPVFIAAYCDVNDFDELARGYADFIGKRDYSGYSTHPDSGGKVETLYVDDQMQLFMEQRRRKDRVIVFYHVLLNMSA